MAEAPQLPPDPFATLPPRAGAARPDPPPRPLQVGVVLAAGRSERLDALTRGGSKALLRLGGLSLVERAVRSLLARGLQRVLVVVGHDAGPVAAVVGRLGRGGVRAVYADRWRDGNGASLTAVEGEATVAGELLFVLLTTDHLFGEGALDRLLGAAEPAVLVDAAPDRAAWQEGCKVRVVDGAVVAFGKHLDDPAIDCGAFLLPPEVFDCQRQAAAEGDQTLAGAVTRLTRARPLRAVPLPAGCWWQDVDTPQDAQAARVALRRSLGKDTDGPVSRFINRPLSTRISMALAPLRPAPDLVSMVAFALGLAGAALLAAGRGVAGALLVHASSVVDGVDGEVARLQLRGGPRGALLDGVLDRVADAAVLGGLGLWALDGHDAPGVLALTVAATVGALLSMATKDRAAALGLPPAPERALGWLLGGRDGRLLLVTLGALLGAPLAALAAVTATSALSLGLRVAFLRRPPAA
jgi:1L-myo-inositol 1-phosphate cytidylyltransferase / CDP-L-myo-inositol myo-inositolphosphotransferase